MIMKKNTFKIKPKTHMVSIRLDSIELDRINIAINESRLSRSQLVRIALYNYFRKEYSNLT
jgi:hypothetical protein